MLVLATTLWNIREVCADAFTGTGSGDSSSASLTKSRLGLVYIGFSGKTGESFDSAKGFGLEFQREKLFSWASSLFKVRLESSNATKSFDDSGTSRSLAYKYIAAFGAVGLKFTPFQSSARGLNLYMGLAADLGFAQVTLPAGTYTSLKSSDSNLAYGFELQTGFSIPIGGHGSKDANWGIFVEAVYRQITANLENKSSFNLGGIQLSGGFYW